MNSFVKMWKCWNDDNDPFNDEYGYKTRLYTMNKTEGLSESCDISTENKQK